MARPRKDKNPRLLSVSRRLASANAFLFERPMPGVATVPYTLRKMPQGIFERLFKI